MSVQIIILIYFIAVIGVGIYSMFRIKKPDDYYVAGGRAGIFQTSGSLLATILGGSAILGTIELSQKTGWSALWFLFSAAAGLFILLPLSKKVKQFGHFTLPEILGRFYGKPAEIIASIIIPLAWVGIVAAQIIASAKILNGLGFISYQNAALLSGAVFIIYTLIGGQLSILKTDLIQAILILAGLFALVVFTAQNKQSIHFEHFKINLLFNHSFTGIDLLILILTYSVTFVVGPDIYSRIFCARDFRSAQKSVLLVAIILLPVSFALTYLGVYSSQTSEPGIISFAQHLLPGWAYGLFIAALLSAVMSSADTTLLTSSIIIAELITGNLNKTRALKLTRFFIILMGIMAILTALYITSIIQALLLALAFFSGAFVVPTIAGLLNLKINPKNVTKTIIVGGVIALTGKIISITGYQLTGNIIIISAYPINTILLFWRAWKPE